MMRRLSLPRAVFRVLTFDGCGDCTCPICLNEFSQGDEFFRTVCFTPEVH